MEWDGGEAVLSKCFNKECQPYGFYFFMSVGNQRREKLPATTSRFKGVYFYKRHNKWRSKIQHNRKVISLGYYDKEEDAARAYNKKALELYGECALINEVE